MYLKTKNTLMMFSLSDMVTDELCKIRCVTIVVICAYNSKMNMK